MESQIKSKSELQAEREASRAEKAQAKADKQALKAEKERERGMYSPRRLVLVTY